MGLAGTLDLRHVSAVELDMTSPRPRLGDMPREGDRDEPVASTPDEQRIGLQPAQAGPETVLAVGFLQVDMARRERRRPGGAGGRDDVQLRALARDHRRAAALFESVIGVCPALIKTCRI